MTEVDSVRALEAVMDGYRVMPIAQASVIGDIFVTATGDVNVIDGVSLDRMKDGAVLANSGHFNAEINLPYLESVTVAKRTVRSDVEELTIKDGRKLFLLGEGRLVNLAAAEGHPSSVMDMSFANQALCLEYLACLTDDLEIAVHSVPKQIDMVVAQLKLKSLGVNIDELSDEQKKYLESWEEGT